MPQMVAIKQNSSFCIRPNGPAKPKKKMAQKLGIAPKSTYFADELNTCKMSTKLTLTVNKNVIEQAKKYAKANGRSLSNIIEEYLKSLIEESSDEKLPEDFEISPEIMALWGSVKPIPDSIDYKELLEEELMEKYLEEGEEALLLTQSFPNILEQELKNELQELANEIHQNNLEATKQLNEL